jgi:hypothetical protein
VTARKGRSPKAAVASDRGPAEERSAHECTSPAAAPPAATAGDREPDYTWSGRPVFKCRALQGCQYQRVENLASVLEHERVHAPAPAPERESLIVGTNGRPLKVEGR